MSETKNRGLSPPKPAIPWGLNVPTEIVPMADEVIPWALVMRDFWKKMLAPFRGGGIRRRLLMWGLSLFGITLLGVVVAGYSYTVRQIRHDAAALQSELASVTGESIRNFVRRKIERFSDTADALSLYQLGSKEQQLLLGLLVKNDSSFSHASIINSQGMEVVKVSDRKVYFPSDLADQSKSPKFINALKGEDYISRVYTSNQAQPYVTLAIPLWGAAQSIVGVVSAEADLSFLWEVIGKIHFATAGYAYLVDEHGNLIAHRDATLVLKRLDLRQVAGVQKFLRNPTRSDPTAAQEGRGLLDKPVLSTYAPVPELGWAVILEEPIDAALASVEILKRSAVVFLVVSLFVGAAIIAWFSQKITRPIQELRQDVATIGAGNLEHRADIKSGDEIEDLAVEFNKMTEALQDSYATLEQKVEQRTQEISAKTTELGQMNQELQEANRAKTEFIAAMSHELRTPLNVIMGNAELTGDSFFGEVNADQKNAMTKIQHHGKFLLKLVNDVLALSQLDAKKMSLELASVNINEIVTHSQSHIEQLNRVKGLQVCWDVEQGLPDIVTDATKLEEILQNLIGNAFKFTLQGRIDVRIRNIREQSRIEFCIADTGIGIEAEDMDRIFRAFEQIREAHTGEFNGVGLGLNIVKKYLDLMKGDIRVQSRPDEGSTFTFSLPHSIPLDS